MTHMMSIQRRLLIYLGISLPMLWLFIAIIAAIPIYREVNAADDDVLRNLAFLVESWQEDPERNQDIAEELALMNDIEGVYYVVWNRQGQLISRGKPTAELTYRAGTNGFVDSQSRYTFGAWRLFYLQHRPSGKTIAVGQPWRERYELILSVLLGQIGILLLSLPLFLFVVLWAVRKGLKPLHALTKAIQLRHAQDLTPVTQSVPSELQPLSTALNQLFHQVSSAIEKEQRFTADAAHELRSPLAAIKIQTDTLCDSEDMAVQAQRIQHATDRAIHLVDQLLTMARLDPVHQSMPEAAVQADWLAISDAALQSVNLQAREKQTRLKRIINADSDSNILPIQGDAALLTVLLRNLLDNSIRYGGSGGEVDLILASDYISVRDQGNGIAPEALAHIRERFFRPSGQRETGSGLGLSIVERIAELHGLQLTLANSSDGGLLATIHHENSSRHA